MEYINVNVFSHVVSLRYVLITAVIILSVMMFMISVLVYVKRYPNTEKGIMAKISDKINVEYQKIFNNYNNLFKEIHKTLLTSKGIWLIAAAIFAAVYFSTTGYVTFNDLQIQNDKLYKEHGGKDYTYIKNYASIFAFSKSLLMILAVLSWRFSASVVFKPTPPSGEAYAPLRKYEAAYNCLSLLLHVVISCS